MEHELNSAFEIDGGGGALVFPLWLLVTAVVPILKNSQNPKVLGSDTDQAQGVGRTFDTSHTSLTSSRELLILHPENF